MALSDVAIGIIIDIYVIISNWSSIPMCAVSYCMSATTIWSSSSYRHIYCRLQRSPRNDVLYFLFFSLIQMGNHIYSRRTTVDQVAIANRTIPQPIPPLSMHSERGALSSIEFFHLWINIDTGLMFRLRTFSGRILVPFRDDLIVCNGQFIKLKWYWLHRSCAAIINSIKSVSNYFNGDQHPHFISSHIW